MIEISDRRKVIAVGVVCAAAVLFLRLAMANYAVALTVLGILIGAALGIAHLARACWQAWPEAVRSILCNLVRARRRLQALYRPSPVVKFLAPLTLTVFIVAVSTMTVLPALWRAESPRVISYTGLLLLMLLVPLGAIECIHRFVGWMRLAWARTMGKVILTGLGLLASVAAHIIATHLAFEINPVDKKYVSDFIQLTTLLLVPIVYVYAAGILVALYIVLEWAGLLTLLLVYLVASSVKSLAWSTAGGLRAPIAFAKRTAFGRRFLSAPKVERVLTVPLLALRILAMIVCFSVTFSGGRAIAKHFAPGAKSLLSMTLVVTEYHHGRYCNLTTSGDYLPLDNNAVSIAYPKRHGFGFRTIDCSDVHAAPHGATSH